METKLSKLVDLMTTGKWDAALSMASKFPRLGEHADDITRGDAAIKNRRFYTQIGQNPDELRSAGIAALKKRYAKTLATAL